MECGGKKKEYNVPFHPSLQVVQVVPMVPCDPTETTRLSEWHVRAAASKPFLHC